MVKKGMRDFTFHEVDRGLLEAWTIWICANVEIREGERIRKELGSTNGGGVGRGAFLLFFRNSAPSMFGTDLAHLRIGV